MYGTHGAASATSALANVKIGLIKDAAGQELRNGLLDRMPAAIIAPRYLLNITLTETQAGIAIATDATVTRQQLRTVLHAELIDGQIQKPVWKQDLFAVSGYNVLESQFSTLVGEQDARKRNVDDLAERLVNMLALYFDLPDTDRAARQAHDTNPPPVPMGRTGIFTAGPVIHPTPVNPPVPQ